jgi:hypothetical protein
MTMTCIRTFRRLLQFLPLVLSIAAVDAWAVGTGASAGWVVEQGTDDPSYAVVEPATTSVNIDKVVLACEQAWTGRVLQLQLHLVENGLLQPNYPHAQPLRDNPRAVILVDKKIFPVSLLFADDYVVLADAQKEPVASLSDQLIDALQSGSLMTLRFQLLDELPDQPPVFDGEAVMDLRAPGGREAIAAVTRCADPRDAARQATFRVGR